MKLKQILTIFHLIRGLVIFGKLESGYGELQDQFYSKGNIWTGARQFYGIAGNNSI